MQERSTEARLPRYQFVFAFVLICVVVVVVLAFALHDDPKSDSEFVTNEGAESTTSASADPNLGLALSRLPANGDKEAEVGGSADRALLLRTFEGLYENHLAKLHATDDERYAYMMTKPDDRFLTKGLAMFSGLTTEIPPPALEAYRGLGFSGEIGIANVLERQAKFLSEFSRGRIKPDEIVLSEDQALFDLPVEAIVAALSQAGRAELKSDSALNMAAIRDQFMGQFARANEEEWFITSAIWRTYLNLDLPINHEDSELQEIFPEFARVRAEKDALARQYLDALKLELGL